MMEKEIDILYDLPVGMHFSNIAKQYIGVLTKKLSHLELDKYYFTIAIIDKYNSSLTQQQLADILGIDKVYMVKIIDYLSKKGMVKRKRNITDRREYIPELTPNASKSMDDIKIALKETNEATFKGIPDKEMNTFYNVLKKVALNLAVLPSEKVDFDIRKRK